MKLRILEPFLHLTQQKWFQLRKLMRLLPNQSNDTIVQLFSREYLSIRHFDGNVQMSHSAPAMVTSA